MIPVIPCLFDLFMYVVGLLFVGGSFIRNEQYFI